MYSKWKIWDFFKGRSNSVEAENKGVHAFKVFEPKVQQYIKDALSPSLVVERPRIEVGADVSLSQLENCFCGLSLFGTKEVFIVIDAQNLSSDVQKYITSSINVFSDGHLILFFQESTSFYKQLVKEDACFSIEIEPPFFWEFIKLFDFLCERKGVTFSYDAKNYFVESINPSLLDFDFAIDTLIINFPQQRNFEKKHIDEVLSSSKFDQFKLATVLSERKIKDFYEILLSEQLSFDEYRTLFSFLQSHLIRLSDPGYAQKKNRLSKYDKEIIGLSRKWNLDQLQGFISLFSNWEILSKKRDVSLNLKIRREYFKVCYPLSPSS